MSIFELKTPPGLYQVSYMHSDGVGVVPACDLTRARQEAKDRANQFGVVAVIEGIGPENGFREIVKPDVETIEKYKAALINIRSVSGTSTLHWKIANDALEQKVGDPMGLDIFPPRDRCWVGPEVVVYESGYEIRCGKCGTRANGKTYAEAYSAWMAHCNETV